MEPSSTPVPVYGLRAYLLLTKPGIIVGNAITTSAGFALASKEIFDVGRFFACLMGLSMIIGSACIFNNYIDRTADLNMERTKNRALALGLISARNALFFALFMLLSGALILLFFTNPLSMILALFGFFSYVILYSFSKYHTIHGTLIGSLAGAAPPVVGYCSASGALDLNAMIFFVVMTLWQMPHFFAITIYRLKDYQAASIPVLPIKKGLRATKMQMLLYIMGFIITSILLVASNQIGIGPLMIVALLGFGWLGLCILGFQSGNDLIWARKMFVASLAVIVGLSAALLCAAI